MNTVVMVDNDGKWLANYKRMLAPLGEEMNCMYFNHSEEAMEYMTANPTAVLVSEMDMPVMSGRELFEMVDMLSPETVKIAVTQVRDVAETLDIINHGKIYRLILKPFFLVEDLTVPIQAGLKHYEIQKREKEFHQKITRKLQKLDGEAEVLFQKMEEKKRGYDIICQAAANIMKENLRVPVSEFSSEEGQIVGDFCKRLLEVYIQYHMYEKRNFIFYVNDLKNQFHHPGKARIFQIYNQTGEEIPMVIMNRIAYGAFLIGHLCQQCLQSYHVEIAVEATEDNYILKSLCQYSEHGPGYKVSHSRVRKLLKDIVKELEYSISDRVVRDVKGQRMAEKLYFFREEGQR